MARVISTRSLHCKIILEPKVERNETSVDSFAASADFVAASAALFVWSQSRIVITA
jgi:hypothetical protein